MVIFENDSLGFPYFLKSYEVGGFLEFGRFYFPRARVLRDLEDLGDLEDLESSLDVSGVGIWGISGLRQLPYLGSVGDLW